MNRNYNNRVVANSIKKEKKSILDSLSDGTNVKKTVIIIAEKLYKSDTGFGIYLCSEADNKNEDSYHKYSIKGIFPTTLTVGQTYEVEGIIQSYKTELYTEKQISVKSIHSIKPLNKKGILAYLKNLKGLKTKADLIYEKYGEKSIEILRNSPEEVAKNIKGIGNKTALSWAKQLSELENIQGSLTRLLGYGLTSNQCKKLLNEYGEKILLLIEKNPYYLAKEVSGYGFKSCDRVAMEMGHDYKSKFRIQEAIIHVLEEAALEGHCYLPIDELLEKSSDLLTHKLSVQDMIKYSRAKDENIEYIFSNNSYTLNTSRIREAYMLYSNESNPRERDKYRHTVATVSREEIKNQFENLIEDKRIVIDCSEHREKIYLSYLYISEVKCAERVKKLCTEVPFKNNINLKDTLDKYCKEKGLTLESKQEEAVLKFAKNKGGFFILTGGAGRGKTFVLKIILDMLKIQYSASKEELKHIKIFATTGKAAKVVAKATGRECLTIHKGLGYQPEAGFKYNEYNKLQADLIIVDEASMLDIQLIRHLLDAVEDLGTKIILIGDINQIPSVGPGNVLKDLINSNYIDTVMLNVVKRQALLSGINKNANKILNKEDIYSCLDTEDAYIITKEDIFDIQETIIRFFKRTIDKYNYPIEQIQVLCPQKTSQIGTNVMNYLMQEAFNKNDSKINIRNKIVEIKRRDGSVETQTLYFKQGDKIINIKNNYNTKWYTKDLTNSYVEVNDFYGITNGETGIVEEIIETTDENNNKILRLVARYDDGFVFYDNDFSMLDHAYALTIHKSQGSQWKAIIIPIAMQNYLMLDNNLFYTAYTRAESLCITIAQIKAMKFAINNSRMITRYTSLKFKIQNNSEIAI